MVSKRTIAIIILSILLLVSGLLNLLLVFTVSAVDIEWCETNNDYASFINDLVIELQYYDSAYEEIPLFEMADCWAYEAGD